MMMEAKFTLVYLKAGQAEQWQGEDVTHLLMQQV